MTTGALLPRILPSAVASVEAFGDAEEAPLMAEEVAYISRAVERRRREYAAVRHCARQAMRSLGLLPAAIPSGPRREPLWPPGVVGSMTHCAGYRAAAVARSSRIATIGIDAEPHEPLPPDVLRVIALERERDHLAELATIHPATHWDRLLFSAKETVYKAWFPLTGKWLGFEQASITLDPRTQRFSAHLLVPGPWVGGTRLSGFTGRWLTGKGLLVTAIALAQPSET